MGREEPGELTRPLPAHHPDHCPDSALGVVASWGEAQKCGLEFLAGTRRRRVPDTAESKHMSQTRPGTRLGHDRKWKLTSEHRV